MKAKLVRHTCGSEILEQEAPETSGGTMCGILSRLCIMPTFESIITGPNSSWIHRLWPDERRELTAPVWKKLASLEGQVTSHRLPIKWIQIEWRGPNASALTRDCCDDFFFCFQRCCVDNAPFHVTRVMCHRCIVASDLALHASTVSRLIAVTRVLRYVSRSQGYDCALRCWRRTCVVTILSARAI